MLSFDGFTVYVYIAVFEVQAHNWNQKIGTLLRQL